MELRAGFNKFCTMECFKCDLNKSPEECIDAYCYEQGRRAGRGENGSADMYQILASRTINKELKTAEQELHALHGMVGEVGELHSLHQKVYQGHGLDIDHAKKELGDLLWFISEYCTANNWSLQDVMNLNIAKLRSRYPEGFEADKSLNRKQGDI